MFVCVASLASYGCPSMSLLPAAQDGRGVSLDLPEALGCCHHKIRALEAVSRAGYGWWGNVFSCLLHGDLMKGLF